MNIWSAKGLIRYSFLKQEDISIPLPRSRLRNNRHQSIDINRILLLDNTRHQKNRSTKISWIEIWNLSFISPFTVAFKSGISKNFFAFAFHKNGIHRLESLLRKNHWMGQWLEMFRKPKSTNFTWYDQTFKIVIPKLFFFY